MSSNSIVYATLIDTRDVSTPGHLGTLELSGDNGYVPQSLEVGMPNTRAVSEDWADRDGVNDTTLYIGARAVTFAVALLPERMGGTEQVLRDQLTPWLHPSLRPRLEYQLQDTDTPRSVQVRFDQGASFVQDFTQVNFTGLAIGWVAPNGLIEGISDVEYTVRAGGNVAESGRAYNLTFDRTYPAQTGSGTVFVVNEGTASVFPLIRIYGPCTNPVIENRTSGKFLRFTANTGITLTSGDYIEVNMATRTAYRTGNSANSMLNRLNFTTSEWWSLAPGSNVIVYSPATFDVSAAAIITFRPAYL